MTEKELLRKIREASEALEEYNSGKIQKSLEPGIEREILTESRELFSKSHAVQASGLKCPCCNGSGAA